MPINFAKLGESSAVDRIEHPRELFAVLRKPQPRYQYPRDVQAEVWDQWFGRRTERDLVIKMTTGAGKTVVGLLLLKALLNGNIRPAVYVAPDPYLASQVRAEAEGLGIDTTDDSKDVSFLQGRRILVTTIHKVFNGRSVFGVGDAGAVVPIGAVVVDDAHACMAAVEEKFTLSLPTSHPAYGALFAIFRAELAAQSPTTLLDIEAEDPTRSLLVPFWLWHDQQAAIASTLHEHRNTDALGFSWPLVREVLPLCQCVVSGNGIEITPRCIPVDVIPSFANAARRIFMTATLADDSILVTDFDVAPQAAEHPITPSRANDVGDRLILMPQVLNPAIADEDLRDFAASLASTHNVVVIVPSGYQAAQWDSVANQTLRADNLPAGIARLRKEHVGLTVIVNKYDGIDLPDDACRVLILDGLPDVRSRFERIEQAALQGSTEAAAAMMQRLEQGMGRGVRSNTDRCVVLLTGRSLIRQLYTDDALRFLTTATRAQYELSQTVAGELHGQDLGELRSVIDQVLRPDPGWLQLSRGALVNLKYATAAPVSAAASAKRAAFNLARSHKLHEASEAFQPAITAAASTAQAGWLRLEMAAYTHAFDALLAQRLLGRAIEDNRYLPTRPRTGLDYRRLGPLASTQGAAASAFLRARYPSGNAMRIAVYGLLAELVFRPGTARAFEAALADIAPHLGFIGQEPEREFGHGPDVLWSLGDLRFLVIEAKNGATTPTINKHDTNQLTGSLQWFSARYDASCAATPVLIHPSAMPDRAATAHPETRVMREPELAAFVAAVNAYTDGLVGQWPPEARTVGEQLSLRGLDAPHLVARFTVPTRASR